MQAFIAIWAILVFLVLLNGFSAGIAAALHVWQSQRPRRSRALIAAAITGLVPATLAAPALIEQGWGGAAAGAGMLIGFAVLCGLAMGVSLPGAVVIARKLDGPGNAYKTFE